MFGGSPTSHLSGLARKTFSRFIRAVLRDCRKAPRPSRAATTNIEFRERGCLIHQVVEMPLKRRNIVLGFFEISLECFQPMLLLWVGVVGYPRRTPTAESQVGVSKPGIVQEKTSIHAFGALQLTLYVVPSFPCHPRTRTRRNKFIWQGAAPIESTEPSSCNFLLSLLADLPTQPCDLGILPLTNAWAHGPHGQPHRRRHGADDCRPAGCDLA